MIFVATGTQFPFDRLVKYMDEWVSGTNEDVFVQLGDGEYHPQNIKWERFLGLDDYDEKIKSATVFISHAGMGNIISAKDHGVPIIVINRQAALGEHRNDHQADGLKWMGELEGVYTSSSKEELYELLAQREQLKAFSGCSEESLNDLVGYLNLII